MDEKQESFSNENRQAELPRDSAPNTEQVSDIGTGKKVGLYGCGFMILAVVIIFIVLALTGFYNRFQGTEGVGP